MDPQWSKTGRGGQGGRGGPGGGPGIKYEINYYEALEALDEMPVHRHKTVGTAGVMGKRGKNGIDGTQKLAIQRMKKKGLRWLDVVDFPEYFDQEIDSSSSIALLNDEYNATSAPTWTEHAFDDEYVEYLEFIVKNARQFRSERLLPVYNKSSLFVKILNENIAKPNLLGLVKRCQLISSNSKFHHLFVYLRHQITAYKNKTQSDSAVSTVLTILLTLISSTVSRQESVRHAILVLNVENFIDSTMSLIRNWKKLEHQNLKRTYVHNYVNNLQTRINESIKIYKNTRRRFKELAGSN